MEQRHRAALGQAKLRCVFKSLHKRACTGLCKHIANSLRERPCFCSRRWTLAPRLPKAQGCGWLAKRGDVLEKHPKARLRVSLQNSSGIRATNQPWVFGTTNQFIRVNP